MSLLSLPVFEKHLKSMTVSRQFVVAYSGGIDSHVLLHLMSQVSAISLRAIYIHHGLSPQADQWQTHCASVCHMLGVAFESISITVEKKPRHSLEATARDLRYQALFSCLEAGSVLLTGHNQNDQAETILLQLMRGAGIAGLSAMPLLKSVGQSYHLRPLLQARRSDIESYAKTHALCWIEDESNATLHFDRNFLRHDVMPRLLTRRAGVIENMARSAVHMAEALELVQALAQIDYELVKMPSLCQINSVALQSLSTARQTNVIRYWLKLQQPPVSLPSQAVLQQICAQLLYSTSFSRAVVRYSNCIFTRQHDVLILSRSIL